MGRQWTEAQQAVIQARGGNLLVSAAAGSGKTAVLVEHILSRLSDPEHPLDVDRLLIVTFTRAAAAEMRERLTRALEAAVEAGNTRLERQLSLLPHAHISTIDSFCMWVVKNHFSLLDLDPDFRMGEEGELELLRAGVLADLLEARYRQRSLEFQALADAYSGEKNGEALEQLVLGLYDFAQSAPYPEQWLEQCRAGFGQELSGLDGFPWAGALLEENQRCLRSLREQLGQALETARSVPVLEPYEAMFQAERAQVDALLEETSLSGWIQRLSQVSFGRRPYRKNMAEAAEIKERLDTVRDWAKAQVARMRDRYCLGTPEEMFQNIRRLALPLGALIDLTEDFAKAYQEAKREKNLAEFSDVAHWALQLLDGPTELALSLGEEFQEIAVDEYQDSNRIQERILTAISGVHRGQPNLFLVGDVKQSIYKFRRARPELFLEKYHAYSPEPGAREWKIDLNKNFRTRPRILDLINHVFYQLMGEELGGVDYTPEAALYPGASYPPDTEPVELLYAQRQEADRQEAEAGMICRRIQELMGPGGMQVWDEEQEEYRPLRYRDIVILLRSGEGWVEPLAALLNRSGIPAVTQQKKGYFSAQEVQVVLSLLKVLDNPRQDIPLAAVLLSPLGGFSEEELARLPGREEGAQRLGEDDSLYSRCRRWDSEKMQDFLGRLEQYRELSACLPVPQLLDRILEESSYLLYLSALPGGETRRANVEMLREKAMEFENTSLHGLFQFNRYMEQIRKYQVDYGPASGLSQQDDLVRITTIHQSKGLEYPVVFVAGLSKKFNLQDSKSRVLFHEDGGIASDVLDTERMAKIPCLWKQVLAERLDRDTKGEELRLLYVAMTRAREKLILTASGDSLEKAQEDAAAAGYFQEQRLPGWYVERAGSYLDWILRALARDPHGVELRLFTEEELTARETEQLGRGQWLRTALPEGLVPGGDAEQEALWEKRLAWAYPWQALTEIRSAYSVSQLKEAAGGGGAATGAAGAATTGAAGTSPQQAAGGATAATGAASASPQQAAGGGATGAAGAALRGTLYHRVLERLSPEDGENLEAIQEAIRRVSGEIPETAPIDPEDIARFYRSPLGRRVQEAFRRGKRQTEHPFVMGLPVSRLPGELRTSTTKVAGAAGATSGTPAKQEAEERLPSGSAEELVLVQGIIDLFLEEADGLVLVDYKTDAAREETLRRRYQSQLALYREALERALGKPVKETWIYSFHLGREVFISET